MPPVSQNACDLYHLKGAYNDIFLKKLCQSGYYRLQIPLRPLGQSETLQDRETRDRDKTEPKDFRGCDKTKTTKK